MVWKTGEAPVKKEYCLPLKTEVVSEEKSKEPATSETKSSEVENAITTETKQREEKTAEKNDENSATDLPPKEQEDASGDEPPKKKMKGQNKARGRTVPKMRADERICPNLLSQRECRFGDSCKFNHDIQKYIDNRPPDIGDRCVNYEVTGKCRYGLECRYSKPHITADHINIVDEQKHAKYVETCEKRSNVLSRDLMSLLRKKKYNFKRSDQYMARLRSNDDIKCDAFPVKEKKKVDFKNKLSLAPLTTVGNLPFRRICKRLGADITCGEMAMTTNLLQGSQAEWALVKRHHTEDVFGVQLCGGYPDTMSRVTELLNNEFDIDFIDINLGCPIDLVFKKGEGSALMGRMTKLEKVVKGMVEVSDIPITIKMRTGIYESKSIAHKVVPLVKEWGVDLITLHGRSREQRYTRAADWSYINTCAELASPVPFYGNGDILSYEDANLRRENTNVSGLMIARGALIKPWIFTEIKEQRHWDITAQERLEFLREFTNYGLEHWGSDTKGVENTRRFMLEWLSFLYRYIPVGLLEVMPQKINDRPPLYFGRNDLETLFASQKATDWVKISEMLLGPVPDNFTFIPKHKANSYS